MFISVLPTTVLVRNSMSTRPKWPPNELLTRLSTQACHRSRISDSRPVMPCKVWQVELLQNRRLRPVGLGKHSIQIAYSLLRHHTWALDILRRNLRLETALFHQSSAFQEITSRHHFYLVQS